MTVKPSLSTGKHCTSKDVAALAGVSQSAVSRCFTPGASVAKQTRKKVLEAASALGYRPNMHARTLITGKTRMIGVVLGHLDNLFYPRFLQLMAERLQSLDMQLLLFVADANRESDLMEKLLAYRVDGIVLAATTLNAELARACTAAGIPVVLFNRVPTNDLDRAFHSVQTDHESGTAEMTRLLIKNGHTRIAYLAGHTESPTNQLRELGCRKALRDANLSMFAYGIGNYDGATARDVTREWFLEGNRLRALENCPDAVVAADDQMALSVLNTLRFELNLNVPEQVSVVGFDDVPQTAWPSHELTTYSQPLPEMIEEVIRLLSIQLEPGKGQSASTVAGQAVIIPGRLCLRGSVKLSTDKRNKKITRNRQPSSSV